VISGSVDLEDTLAPGDSAVVVFFAIICYLNVQSPTTVKSTMRLTRSAIFCLNIMGLYVAYGIPIFARVMWGKKLLRPGPWYLGKYSIPMATIACAWMAFAIVIFCFPGDPNPTATTMNYAVVVSAGVWIFAGGYYFLPKWGGKTFFV
jgi:hypothetical protein